MKRRIISRLGTALLLVGAAGVGWTSSMFSQPAYTFTRLAGSAGGPGAVDAAGIGTRLNDLQGIVHDPTSGNLYIVDRGSQSVRVISPSNGVTSLAGTPDGIQTDGRRAEVRFRNGRHLAVDGSGNLYLPDAARNVIFSITPQGMVRQLAGREFLAGSHDGPSAEATFNEPEGIAFHLASGNLYVADRGNHTIRRISPEGDVTTLAGLAGASGSADGNGSVARFFRPGGLATDSEGNVYVGESGSHTIRKITPAGTVSTLAGLAGVSGNTDGIGADARFSRPEGITIDGAGYLYVAEGLSNRIRRISPDGAVITLAGSTFGHQDGMLLAARFARPFGVTVDAGGTLHVTEQGSPTVRRVTSAGVVTTVAGVAPSPGAVDGSLATALFNNPVGLAIDPSGNLHVADQYNYTIRRIAPDGTVTALAGLAGASGHADATGSSARFTRPVGLSSDAAGNLYVGDAGSHTIRKVTPAGQVTTLAGLAHESGTANGTTTLARFNQPGGTATDAAGNVYVADTANHAVRKISPAGVVSTLAGFPGSSGGVNGTGSAARFSFPSDVALDSDGNVYVADSSNHAIRRITPAGVVTTFAGAIGVAGSVDGAGTAARLFSPGSVAIDSLDNLFVGEHKTIRHITSGGVVTTIAGDPTRRESGDGTGIFARFSSPQGLDVDPSGNIYVADSDNSTLRKGAPALEAAATVDAASGPVFETRQLSTSPNPGTTWRWDLVRKPTGSAATLSSSTISNPTFTPDLADRYVFRLTTSAIGPVVSITEVALTATCQSITIGPASFPQPSLGWPYGYSLAATPAVAVSWAITEGTIPPGFTFSAAGRLSGTATTPGTYMFTVSAIDGGACAATPRQYTITLGTLDAPAGLVATGSAASVALSWLPVSGAAGYRILRKSTGAGSFVSVGTSEGPAFTDTSVALSRTYVYRVRALDSSMIESADSNSDLATTFVFTDPALTSGVTTIKAVHITQLRTVITQVRSLADVSGEAFTDPTLAAVRIKAVHITELRSAIAAARSALGLEPQGFTDSSLAGVVARGVHVTELREGVQ